MYLNKAIIIGNLTRDPEMKQLPSGTSVTTFSLATNRVYKDKEGNKQEQTDYHNMVVFGRSAETVAQYLKKGSMALVEGRIQTRSWTTRRQVKRIIVQRLSQIVCSLVRAVVGQQEGAQNLQKRTSQRN